MAARRVAAGETEMGESLLPEPREQLANTKPSREAAVASLVSGVFIAEAEALAFWSQKIHKDVPCRCGVARNNTGEIRGYSRQSGTMF